MTSFWRRWCVCEAKFRFDSIVSNQRHFDVNALCRREDLVRWDVWTPWNCLPCCFSCHPTSRPLIRCSHRGFTKLHSKKFWIKGYLIKQKCVTHTKFNNHSDKKILMNVREMLDSFKRCRRFLDASGIAHQSLQITRFFYRFVMWLQLTWLSH